MSAKRQLVVKAFEALKRLLSGAPPDRMAAAARRLGLNSATPERLLAAAKNNKLGTALVLYEVGGLANPALQELMAGDSEIEALVQQLGYEPDHPEDTESVTDISRFSNEFATIAEASRIVGGHDRLMALMNALDTPRATHLFYRQVKSMAGSL